MRRFTIVTAAMMSAFWFSCQYHANAFREIFNVPGTSNVNQYVVNPIPIQLDAGKYIVTPVEPPFPGALYTAYSFYSDGGVWGWEVDIANGTGPDRILLMTTYRDCCFSNPNIAFQDAAFGGTFTLNAPQTVYVGVGDSNNADNTGGVSFLLTSATAAIPEIATWAMLLLGFAGVCFAGYRRAKQRSGSGLGPTYRQTPFA